MPASFTLPIDVLRKLGNGDCALGLAVLRDALGGEPIAEGQFVSPNVLTALGHGNLNAGRRVLQKLISRIRHRNR